MEDLFKEVERDFNGLLKGYFEVIVKYLNLFILGLWKDVFYLNRKICF